MSWKKESNKWFYYDEKGNKLTSQWFQDDGHWYYLGKDGAMATGWIQTPTDGSRWFYLSPCQQVINGRQYYTGCMVTGWITLENKTYYLMEESISQEALYKGECLVGCDRIIDNVKRSFDNNGVLIQNNQVVSENLYNFIKDFEGCYLKAYYCPSNVLTIGIGNTNPKWTKLGTITEAQAYEAFCEDMQEFSKGVDNLAKQSNVSLTKYEREALISFSFNCGIHALKTSTLWSNICKGNKNSSVIYENFGRWNKGNGGVVLAGLTRRRKCEARLFLTGVYSTKA